MLLFAVTSWLPCSNLSDFYWPEQPAWFFCCISCTTAVLPQLWGQKTQMCFILISWNLLLRWIELYILLNFFLILFFFSVGELRGILLSFVSKCFSSEPALTWWNRWLLKQQIVEHKALARTELLLIKQLPVPLPGIFSLAQHCSTPLDRVCSTKINPVSTVNPVLSRSPNFPRVYFDVKSGWDLLFPHFFRWHQILVVSGWGGKNPNSCGSTSPLQNTQRLQRGTTGRMRS